MIAKSSVQIDEKLKNSVFCDFFVFKLLLDNAEDSIDNFAIDAGFS